MEGRPQARMSRGVGSSEVGVKSQYTTRHHAIYTCGVCSATRGGKRIRTSGPIRNAWAETTMSNPILPEELLDYIVDLLHDRVVVLRSCCLVPKSWIPRTQRHLFTKIKRGVTYLTELGSENGLRLGEPKGGPQRAEFGPGGEGPSRAWWVRGAHHRYNERVVIREDRERRCPYCLGSRHVPRSEEYGEES